MKEVKQILNKLDEVLEPMNEMATAWFDRKANRCAWIENPSGRNNRYFKYLNNFSYSKATKVARISLDNVKYLDHVDSKEQWILTTKEKKELIDLLNMPSNHYANCNRWQEILITYNYDNLQIEPEDTIKGNFKDYVPSGAYFDKGPYSLDYPMPDYTKLKANK